MIEQAQRAAAKVQTQTDARALGIALRRVWPDKRIQRIVGPIMARAEQRASAGWGKWERRAGKRDAADYDGEALVDKWSRDAASKISSVRDEVAEGLRRDVVKALEAGTDPAELAARWKAQGIPVQFGTLEGRVKVIAQHQLASLHAQVQSERARVLGVTEFVWRTQLDDRVRPAHRAREGRTFRYDVPPEDGLPGQPINCRCYAESILPDELTIPIGSVFET